MNAKGVITVFKMMVRNCFAVPHSVLNMVDVVGVIVNGSAKIGDIVTDGNNKYEIKGIPMLNRPAQNPEEVNISIITDNPNALIGKTLVAV